MSLEEVLCKDYFKEKAFKRNRYGFSNDFLSASVIDFDKWMQSLKLDDKNSMNCIFPIASYDSAILKYSSLRGMLVEFKLKCISVPKQRDLKSKNECSRNFLISKCAIDSKSIFIFDNSLISQAINELASWKAGSNKSYIQNFEFMTPADFMEFIKFESDKNNITKHTIDEIVSPFSDYVKSSDYGMAYNHIQIWIGKSRGYWKNMNFAECGNILILIEKAITDNFDAISDEVYKTMIKSQLNVVQSQIKSL